VQLWEEQCYNFRARGSYQAVGIALGIVSFAAAGFFLNDPGHHQSFFGVMGIKQQY